MIQEYLELKKKSLFPETPLKLKHYFMHHYPALILKFGPLIRLWTMHFENKHSYFKRCARHLKNLNLNICLTLSERHQMYQAFLSAGPHCSQLQIKDSCVFYPSLYSDSIRSATRHMGFSESNTSVSTNIEYKCTSCKKGHFLVSTNDECVEFGRLIIILIKNNAAVYFVVEIYNVDYHSECHLYSVTQTTGLQCINIDDLVDFYPLPSYTLNGNKVIPLKHGVL